MAARGRMPGEFVAIARYFAPLATHPGAFGLKDDLAWLTPRAGRRIVLKTDAIVVGVHTLPGDPPDLVARKALRVNLSDLAGKGAEMILMPIWGGDQTLGKARAIENKVFLAASGYDYPTYVMDPDGEVLSLAAQDGTVATATIDLSRRYWHKQLGDMHARRMKELRLDVPPPLPGFEQ